METVVFGLSLYAWLMLLMLCFLGFMAVVIGKWTDGWRRMFTISLYVTCVALVAVYILTHG